MLARVRAAAGPQSLVDLYGSAVYAPQHAADVDVLVSHKNAERLAAELDFELIPTNPPRLRGELHGVDVDIRVVNGNSDEARRMRLGPRDAALLAAQRTPAFDAAWPHVLRFVRLRALGTNGLGYFGSIGWALLVAIPFVQALRDTAPTAALPAWFRWLASLSLGTRVGFDGIRRSDGEPLYIAAPAPPVRDVARLSRRAAQHVLEEARAAVSAATSNEDAIGRIVDIARHPPPGTTLAISGDDEASRGRYEGMARGLVRELETLGPTRSWGRFDVTFGNGWQHCITVLRADPARALIEHRLALSNIDAIVEVR
ncbi:MAG: hypothetical protein SFX73_35230 [Kofleriaceae bacterium]|nr:hypothetical protein [Kofleriaceae bacterium]